MARAKFKLLAVASLSLALVGCASAPSDPAGRAAATEANDPFEPANRAVFEANMALDKWLIEPLAEGYRVVVPPFMRTAIRSFLVNLHEPVVLANNLLQGEVTRAGKTTARFMLNTVGGPLGLRDVAVLQGYEKQTGDFGQTLHAWGFIEGPYLVLPVLGPSNVRDAIGFGVDSFIDPFRYVAVVGGWSDVRAGRIGLEGIDEREQAIEGLDELRRSSLDFYAQLRSVTRQHRTAQLGVPRSGIDPSDLYSDPLTAQVPPAAK